MRYIETVSEFLDIDNIDNSIVLETDIDLTSKDVDNVLFNKISEDCILDGNGHKIIGLETLCNINKGSIRNIKLRSHKTITGSDNFTGGIANINCGCIENVSYKFFIIDGVDCIGGIAGYNTGKILDSYCEGIYHGRYAVGGIAGLNDGSIIECKSDGIVSGVSDLGCISGKDYIPEDPENSSNISYCVIIDLESYDYIQR